MPNYEYECTKCRHRFEHIQKFSDPLLKKCPECGGKLEQVLSAPAVRFKGSGWHVTDYPKQGAKPAEHGESAKSTDAAKSADTAKSADKPKSEPKKDHKK